MGGIVFRASTLPESLLLFFDPFFHFELLPRYRYCLTLDCLDLLINNLLLLLLLFKLQSEPLKLSFQAVNLGSVFFSTTASWCGSLCWRWRRSIIHVRGEVGGHGSWWTAWVVFLAK